MNKRDYFVKALQAQEYRRSSWVISVFALTAEGTEEWKTYPYPYRVVNMGQQGYFFVDPENNNQLTAIEGTNGNEPLFAMKEPFTLVENELPNNPQTVNTNYGTALANAICLCYPFGRKISYIEHRFSAKLLEKLILPRLKDNPENPEDRKPEYIYVDEYLKFTDAIFSLVAYSQLCVPAHTEKSLIQCPGIYQLRDQLLEQHKDRLHDPATIAVIDATLIAFYKDWLKGDDSLGFLINKKSIEIVRKKLFMMHGAETGLEENVSVKLIRPSLSEGWDINAFPDYNNSLRAGSYNRGQQTELGGVAVKELLRASSNLRVTEDDCGSKMGVEILAYPGEEDKLIGFTGIWHGYPRSEGPMSVNSTYTFEKITDENVGKYLGKAVTLRSPMFCRLDKTDYCKTCVGDRLASSPTGLSTVVAGYGSTFLSLFMSAAHAKALTVAKMDYKTAIF